MALEIVASRILAPYFGNSVYVWGSLIGIFLAALSLGYFVGGRVADRWPSRFLLGMIAVVVAALILLIHTVAAPVCRSIVALDAGDRWGPLLAAIALYAFKISLGGRKLLAGGLPGE